MTRSMTAGERRVLLHLGMLKTGSTSIQQVWSGYQDDRVEYADLGLPNHSLILQRAFMEGRLEEQVFRHLSPEQRRNKARTARERLAKVLGATGRSVILSGETMFRYDAGAARRAAEFLQDRVGPVEGLIYIRAPASFARSVFQEKLKFGEASFDLQNIIPPYRKRCQIWARALGAEPTCVMFDRATLHQGDVVADFGHRFGLDLAWAESRRHLQNRNTSMSAEAMAALYLLRHRKGRPVHSSEERMRQRRVMEALEGFGKGKFDFGAGLIDKVLEERAEDIAWVEERLGRPFPQETLKDAVIFSSERDVLEYGEAQAPALREHLLEKGILSGRAEGSTLDLLEAVTEQRVGLRDLVREAKVRHWTVKGFARRLTQPFRRAGA